MQLGLVQIHTVKAMKKMILFMRFLGSATNSISDCNGNFEILPPATQNSVLNTVFAACFLRNADLDRFSAKLDKFFSLNQCYIHMRDEWEGLDPELMGHCKRIKLQRAPMREIAEFYIGFMKRKALEADPEVSIKLTTGDYPDKIQSPSSGITLNDFIPPAELRRRQEAKEKQQQYHCDKVWGEDAEFTTKNNAGGFGAPPKDTNNGVGGQNLDQFMKDLANI